MIVKNAPIECIFLLVFALLQCFLFHNEFLSRFAHGNEIHSSR